MDTAPQDLKDQLGNALGIALALIHNPELIDNRAMSQIERPFKAWCDAIVDGGEAIQPRPLQPPDELVELWWHATSGSSLERVRQLAHHASRWGAELELAACCAELEQGIGRIYSQQPLVLAQELRINRRQSTPSLPEAP